MTKTYVLIAVAAALAFTAALVPAKAVTLATDRVDEITLLDISGTLWRGEANVLYHDFDAGRLAWRMDWPALFDGQLGAHWRLDGAGHELAGRFQRGLASSALTAAGSIDAGNVNRLLGDYDIRVAGVLAVEDLVVRGDDGVWSLAGQLRWTGGRTIYRLSGLTYDVNLPPMVARFATQEGGVVLNATLEDRPMPLFEARLRDGWMEFGITKHLTRLAGKPWPGNAAEDAVVLAVERELKEAWRSALSAFAFGPTVAKPR